MKDSCTKELFVGEDESVEDLKEALQRFILHQSPQVWTEDQVKMLSLRGLLRQTGYYAGLKETP